MEPEHKLLRYDSPLHIYIPNFILSVLHKEEIANTSTGHGNCYGHGLTLPRDKFLSYLRMFGF